MSRTKLLLDVIEDMRSLADSLQAVAEAIGQSDQPSETATSAEKKPRGAKKATEPMKAEPEAKPMSLEDVRAVLAEKSRAGHTAEVRKLLEKHGASKLSEIDPAKYPVPGAAGGCGGAVMGKHALLSASSSHRWLNCPPSARLCEGYEDKSSEYAQEGTDAHSLCEYKLKLALGMAAADPTEDLAFYNEEMASCAEGYADFVMELLAKAKESCADPVVLIEQRLDYSRYVPEGFGIGDCVIIADGTLYIVDYKHGKGVEVSADGNPQMMLYALGALELFDAIYDIDAVQMAIYQPRRENVSICSMTKDDLLRWALGELAERAKLAYAEEGEFACGDWCRFCKAKAICRKRAEHNLELARYDFKMPATLEDTEIAAILVKADELAAWAADVKEFALQQALSGVVYEGFKVVEGRSNRKYTDETAVAAAVSKAGFNPYEQKLLGITAMTALLGKKRFSEIIEKAGLTEKPQGKPTLVPESDKRPPMNTAQTDFSKN